MAARAPVGLAYDGKAADAKHSTPAAALLAVGVADERVRDLT